MYTLYLCTFDNIFLRFNLEIVTSPTVDNIAKYRCNQISFLIFEFCISTVHTLKMCIRDAGPEQIWSRLPLQTVLTLIKCNIMRHFIWVYTVCESACLGVTPIQRVNFQTSLIKLCPWGPKMATSWGSHVEHTCRLI